MLLNSKGCPLDVDTVVVERSADNTGLRCSALLFSATLILCSIPDEYLTVADCTYTVSTEFRIADQKRRQEPVWGTAIAISPNHLVTAGPTVHWLTELRGPAFPDRTSITFMP